jgi:hypothetical protein
MVGAMQTLRLSCSWFWVDVRLNVVNGHWVASADTPYGPSLGVAATAREAIVKSLEGFEGAIDELLASAPAYIVDEGWPTSRDPLRDRRSGRDA